MNPFQSREQKHAEENAENGHVPVHQNSERSPLFSRRNQVIFFATTTSFCLLLIVVGAFRTLAIDGPESVSDETNASISDSDTSGSSSEASSHSSENSSAQKADVFVEGSTAETKSSSRITVNGKDMPLGEDGTLHEVIEDGDNRTSIDVDIQQHSSGSSATSSSDIRIESRSSSSSDGKEDGI